MKTKVKPKKRIKKIYHHFELFKGDGLEQGNCYKHNCISCTFLEIFRNCFPCSSCANLINSDKCYFSKSEVKL